MAIDNDTLPLWYECNDGIYCMTCRDEMIRDWSPEAVRARYLNEVGEAPTTEDEMVRPSDFRALGRRPWAGNNEGDRYMQCDGCNGQWGPDV